MAGPYVATVIIGLVAGIVAGTLSFFVWSLLPHVPAAQDPITDAAGSGRF
jgi:hypothetical protein